MTFRVRFKGKSSIAFIFYLHFAAICGAKIDWYSGSWPLIYICINRLSAGWGAGKHATTEELYRFVEHLLLQLYFPLFVVSVLGDRCL